MADDLSKLRFLNGDGIEIQSRPAPNGKIIYSAAECAHPCKLEITPHLVSRIAQFQDLIHGGEHGIKLAENERLVLKIDWLESLSWERGLPDKVNFSIEVSARGVWIQAPGYDGPWTICYTESIMSIPDVFFTDDALGYLDPEKQEWTMNPEDWAAFRSQLSPEHLIIFESQLIQYREQEKRRHDEYEARRIGENEIEQPGTGSGVQQEELLGDPDR